MQNLLIPLIMKKDFPESIKSKRLELKLNLPSIELATKMFECISKNQAYLEKWLSWASTTNRVEDSLKFLFEVNEKSNYISYGIFAGREFIGNIRIFNINEKNQSCEIGYWLSKDFAGKGYMTEAMTEIEKIIFNNTIINRIVIKCDAENLASAGVAKKLGFELEGRQRQNRFNPYFKELRDGLAFSKLKSDYEQS